MRIKRHKNRNTYLLSGSGVWVRDFTQENVPFQDINRLTRPEDHVRLVDNEVRNRRMNLAEVDGEDFFFRKVLIVSDGYGFKVKHRFLSQMPDDVTILAVNGALAKWELVGPSCPGDEKRSIDFYVVNNPYEECQRFLPRRNRYYPQCVASVWTNPDFVSVYNQRSTVYQYTPTTPQDFSTMSSSSLFCLDDYRNPLCAAIAFAYRCGVERLSLFCCDDSFPERREGAEQLENGLFSYPQHFQTHSIIDANLYWLKKSTDREVAIRDSSSGPKYANTPYIEPDKLVEFYEGRDD